jgi:peptide/nickel transport system permease protein
MHYLQKRILISALVFIVMVNLVFFLPRLVPGNAALILASGSKIPSQEVKVIEARLGLNQPLDVQYGLYLKNIFLTWPPYLGVSYLYYPSTVSSLFAVRIGWSLLLIAASFAVGVCGAYVAAGLTSTKRGGKLEVASLYTAIAFNSTPIFWAAMILLSIFSVFLGWFPLYGNVDAGTRGGLNYAGSVAWHAILPVITLSASLFGESYLLLRGSIQEVLKSDYILAAKARGLRERILSSRYILRNSLLPLVAVLSFSIASLVSRIVLIEAVFGYPGIGDLIVDAVGGRDYPVLEGSLFYLTIIIILSGLVGDVILLRLDPRLKT